MVLLHKISFIQSTPVSAQSKTWPPMKNFDIWEEKLSDFGVQEEQENHFMKPRNISRQNKGNEKLTYGM